jgi:hypothetical protein
MTPAAFSASLVSIDLIFRRFDDEAVGGLRASLLHLECVACPAGDLQRPVNAIEWLADDALAANVKGIGSDG